MEFYLPGNLTHIPLQWEDLTRIPLQDPITLEPLSDLPGPPFELFIRKTHAYAVSIHPHKTRMFMCVCLSPCRPRSLMSPSLAEALRVTCHPENVDAQGEATSRTRHLFDGQERCIFRVTQTAPTPTPYTTHLHKSTHRCTFNF